MDELYTENPARGAKRMREALKKRFKIHIGRRRVKKYMEMLGIQAIYPKKNLSKANFELEIVHHT